MSSNLQLNSAQQKLFDGNQRLISATVNRFHRRITLYGQGDAADLRQELEVALARAARSYRPDAGASFKTFASRCLDNAARDYIRKLKQPPHAPFAAPSHDAVVGYDGDGGPVTLYNVYDNSPTRDEYEDRYDLRLPAIDSLIKTLPELSEIERRALRLRYFADDDFGDDEGEELELTLEEIAERLGCSAAAVHKALERGINKLRRRLR